ncbi:hypothetical protein ELI24_24200 [Rhizobium ruizarguesonis]|nr:hypothetical protein ELI24_24200 [Rhizobium ruizarguesonis]
MIRYIPILRWKRGERVGLQNLSAAEKSRVAPLFLLGSEQFKVKPATQSQAAIPAPAALVQEVLQSWGSGAIFLDASSLLSAPGQPHPLISIAASARASGLALVPVANLGVSPQYIAAIQAVDGVDSQGVCLRVDMQEAFSVSTWLQQWPFPTSRTDLIIDFGENVAMAAALGALLDAMFQGINSFGAWRSVTMAGTSLPQNFTGFTAGQHLIPRVEAQLWSRLTSLPLPYQLDFGDFTSVTPGVTPANIAWGYPINVKYTLPNSFLVLRGVRTTGPNAVDMDVQLRGHASGIVVHASRNRLANAWSDNTIDQIAAGTVGTKTLEHWVQLGVNRHIELMHAILP